MKHKISGRKFSRDIKQRNALFRSLATAVFTHGRIETTITKAKSIAQIVEKIISRAKGANLNAVKFLYSYLYTKDAVKNALKFADNMKDRHGGYTRIVRTRIRVADAATMAIIEIVDDKIDDKK